MFATWCARLWVRSPTPSQKGKERKCELHSGLHRGGQTRRAGLGQWGTLVYMSKALGSIPSTTKCVCVCACAHACEWGCRKRKKPISRKTSRMAWSVCDWPSCLWQVIAVIKLLSLHTQVYTSVCQVHMSWWLYSRRMALRSLRLSWVIGETHTCQTEVMIVSLLQWMSKKERSGAFKRC